MALYKRIKKSNFLQIIILYTTCFILVSSFIASIFLKYQKGFVWSTDALQQHLVTLDYFRGLLLDFFASRKLSFFTWKIGTGLDMFGNLAYYIFGDFFSYFSVLISRKYVYLYFYFLVFVRMYLIGLAFLCYCKHRKMNRFSSNIGALMYTFCSYSLYASVRHPYFSLAIALFPLLCIGIENLVRENEWKYYVFIIAFSTITNFYFSYSMFLILGIYAVILTTYYNKEKGFKVIFLKLIKYLGYSLLGVACASILLIPTVYSFFESARAGGGLSSVYPYSVDYFKSLFPSLITVETSSWRVYGVQSIILLTLPIFFEKKKDHIPFKLLLIILCIPLLFAKVGSVFMFFSYPNLRWSYVFSFLFSYFTVSFLNEERELTKKDYMYIGMFLFFYLLCIVLWQSNLSNLFIFGIMLSLSYLLIFSVRNSIIKKVHSVKVFHLLVLLVFLVGLGYTCSFMYDSYNGQKGYASEFKNFHELKEIYNTDYGRIPDLNEILSYIKNQDKGHYLINTQYVPIQNISLVKDYNSLPIYYSIIPKYLSNLSKDLENRQASMNHETQNFDFRTQITTLLGTKYYIVSSSNSVPYGYEKMSYAGKTQIYKNKYALPFGVLYTDFITEQEYKALSPLEKESALFKTMVLSENENIKHNDTVIDEIKNKVHKKLSYSVEKTTILEENKIKIASLKNNKITLNIENFENSEVYLYISGLEFHPLTKDEKIDEEISKIANLDKNLSKVTAIKSRYNNYNPSTKFSVKVNFQNKNFEETTEDKKNVYYLENKEFVINLGYYNNIKDRTIEIQFPQIGNYTFEDISIIAVSMKDYENDVTRLKQSNFEIMEMNDSVITARANVTKEGILQFATLYSKGWKVFVDGKEEGTVLANQYFLGIPIKEGEHTIILKYHTPYINLGLLASLFAVFSFILLCFIEFMRKNKIE